MGNQIQTEGGISISLENATYLSNYDMLRKVKD